MKYFADIHCHPSLKPFRSNIDSSKLKTIWDKIPTNDALEDVHDILRGILKNMVKNMVKYSESNFDNCLESNANLLFATLYPVERNWFVEREVPRHIIDFFDKDAIERTASYMSGIDLEIVKKIIKNINEEKDIDYFSELEEEYQYYIDQQAKCEGNKQFFIARDYNDIKENLVDPKKPKKIGIVLNIEGGHSLFSYDDYHELKHLSPVALKPGHITYKEYLGIAKSNIKKIKTWGENNDGKHTPFYITFTHHFWNFLCGHADSFSAANDLVLDQSDYINTGFTGLGKEVLNLLLDNSNNQRRILIDIKHMSTNSRKDFYKIWKNHKLNNDGFPIISSHSAVTGLEKYEDSKLQNDEQNPHSLFFNQGDINLFDEDIKMIFESDGLIGLILNESRMPGNSDKWAIRKLKKKIERLEHKPRRSKKLKELKEELKDVFLHIIAANIFHIIKVCNDKKAWDMITLGTDFDGMIDGMPSYITVNDFSTLADDLQNFMESKDDVWQAGINLDTKRKLMYDYSAKEIVEKIMYKNAQVFLEKYFNDDFLKKGIKNTNLIA